MNKLIWLNLIRVLFTVSLLLWITVTIVLFGLGYNVTTFNPNDDMISLLEKSENKINWELHFENSNRSKKISIRLCIFPSTKNHDTKRKTNY
jgi:hypothetical protein